MLFHQARPHERHSTCLLQGILDKFGMGKLMDQLSELKLDELLNTPPPGLDEAIAISKVVEFVESEEYARFTRIVFDTAPTGHTLRMLSLPDFVAATLAKVQRLQSKLGTGGPILQAVFGNPQGLQSSAEQLKKLEARVLTVSKLFRCSPCLVLRPVASTARSSALNLSLSWAA